MVNQHDHQQASHKRMRFILSFVVVCISAAIAFTVHAYALKKIDVLLSKNSEVRPYDAIELHFSFPVITSSVEQGSVIFPSVNVVWQWKDQNKTAIISPQTFWDPQTKYILTIKGQSLLLAGLQENVSFSTQAYPKIVSLLPLQGEKNVSVDIEDPVSVTFDKPLTDYQIKFELNPKQELNYVLSDDKTNIRLLAKNDFNWGTSYAIGVFIKLKKDSEENYRKIGETWFETAPRILPENFAQDPQVRLEQAKQYTQPKIAAGKYIDVSLKNQIMVIFENGKALDAYLVSSGKKGMETPQGTFKIENKSPRAWSKEFSLWMPNWMAILPTGKVGIHELPEWPGGYKEGANHLGTPVSHGCVRLGVGPAERVFDWADLGTPVVIHE